MKQTSVGGNKKKVANILSMVVLVIIFIAYMSAETEARHYQKSVFLAVYHQGPVLRQFRQGVYANGFFERV